MTATVYGPPYVPPAPNPVGWTIDRFKDLFQRVLAAAEVERVRISTNNGKIITINQQADQISDPDRRAAIKAWAASAAKRQGEIASTWRALASRVTWIREQITKFLAGVGLPGLSGLGGPELVVPVAIVAVVLVAWAGVAYIHERNNAQDKGVAMLAQGMTALVSRGATPQQIIDYARAAEAETKALEPKNADPLGLAAIMDALKPVLLALAAIVIVPKVLELIPRRRAAA
jgi:hypothetical protein